LFKIVSFDINRQLFLQPEYILSKTQTSVIQNSKAELASLQYLTNN